MDRQSQTSAGETSKPCLQCYLTTWLSSWYSVLPSLFYYSNHCQESGRNKCPARQIWKKNQKCKTSLSIVALTHLAKTQSVILRFLVIYKCVTLKSEITTQLSHLNHHRMKRNRSSTINNVQVDGRRQIQAQFAQQINPLLVLHL